MIWELVTCNPTCNNLLTLPEYTHDTIPLMTTSTEELRLDGIQSVENQLSDPPYFYMVQESFHKRIQTIDVDLLVDILILTRWFAVSDLYGRNSHIRKKTHTF